MIKYDVVSLSQILAETKEDKEVQNFLDNFKCSKELDLEHFLKKKAILYDRSEHGKTFLLMSKEEKPRLLAFFTLALRSIDISSMGNKARRKLLGNIPGRDGLTSYPCFLIGQLGRDERIESQELKGYIILQEAYQRIKEMQSIVGGRLLILECRPHMYEKFYENQRFNRLNSVNSDGLLTLYIQLNFNETKN